MSILPRDLPPEISTARFAKGQCAVRCVSADGYKTRAGRLAEHLCARYTRREHAYIMSPAKVQKLLALYAAGRDASIMTGELYALPANEGV